VAGVDQDKSGLHGHTVKIRTLSPPASPGSTLLIHLQAQGFNTGPAKKFMNPSNLHPMINVAVKAARAAGALINRAALDVESVRVSQKQANDFVTEVDQAAEQLIIETLLGAYPGHAIWAEESGRTHGAQDSEFVWIIDPLDGTTNFIHGLPIYCVSIALAVKGKVEQAVIYDPSRNDLFTATKGRGSYMNNRRIRVAKRTRLQECLISTGFPFRESDDFNTYLRMMGDMMQRTAGLRRPGAAALDLAYVAAGFTDGFFETGLQPWDVAAGSLLITEAGGLVGNFSGDANFLEQKECMAANPRIYGQMVALLGKYSKFASAGDKATVRAAVAELATGSALEAVAEQVAPVDLTATLPDAPF
jgi:myo-inositol-1(or 4)-monophosphatase